MTSDKHITTIGLVAVGMFILWQSSVSASADLFQDGVDAYEAERYQDAFRIWAFSAKGGHDDSQYRLGRLYEEGKGTFRDEGMAVLWYRRAAEQNFVEAQYALGRINAEWWLRAEGSKQSQISPKTFFDRAVYWYDKAAEQNHQAAEGALVTLKEEWSKRRSVQSKPSATKTLKTPTKVTPGTVAGVRSPAASPASSAPVAIGQSVNGEQDNWIVWSVVFFVCLVLLIFYYNSASGPTKALIFVSIVIMPIVVWISMHTYRGNEYWMNFIVRWLIGAVVSGGAAFVVVWCWQRVFGSIRGLASSSGEEAKLVHSAAKSENRRTFIDATGNIIAGFWQAIGWSVSRVLSWSSAQTNVKTSRRTSEKFEEYRAAASQGDTSAQVMVGDCYSSGHGVRENSAEAVKWYRRAAEQGDPEAQYKLGLCYDFSRGVNQDYEKAARWYRCASEQGIAGAQFQLACCYQLGQGVAQDHKEAAQWYTRAAEQGHVGAQFNLGSLYEGGRGVSKSTEEAKKWYSRAAAQGDMDASARLWMLEAGESSAESHKILHCPYCRQKTRVSNTASGGTIRCKSCEKRFNVETDDHGNIYISKVSDESDSSDDFEMTDARAYDILDVPQGTTPSQVKKAYRNKMQDNHPDKVAQMSEKIRHTAESESKKITSAYLWLKKRGMAE